MFSASRSSRSKMFFKIRVLTKNYKFHRKTPVLKSLFNKLQAFRHVTLLKVCNFVKKRLQHSCFPVKFLFTKHLQWLHLTISSSLINSFYWLLWRCIYQTETILKCTKVGCFSMPVITIFEYRISSNKRLISNKRHTLISAAPLGIHIEISASL